MSGKLYIIFLFFWVLIVINIYGVQYIVITWDYDENQKISITEQTNSVNIGTMSIYSNDKFKVYVTPKILPVDENELVQIQVSSVKVGETTISMDPYFPTHVTTKWLYGTLNLNFIFFEPPNDFMVILTFTFMPL
uniref:Uncharacterized protein n=1 Tax=Fervidobacterium nodosum TaxID=2424 RepID=A0A7C5U6Y6_9BACT